MSESRLCERNGSLPPSEWIFAFLADILSRPLGVGCCSVSQHARCNCTKMSQSLFVERVRVLAPEPKPLKRTAWDRVVNKSAGRDCGQVLGGLVSPVSSCQCLEGSPSFQDSGPLPRRAVPCGQSFPERDGRRNREVGFYGVAMLWQNSHSWWLSHSATMILSLSQILQWLIFIFFIPPCKPESKIEGRMWLRDVLSSIANIDDEPQLTFLRIYHPGA